MNLQATLCQLERDGNLRRIPAESPAGIVDLSTNDYLVIGADRDMQRRFLESATESLTSSASRLLASDQRSYSRLESLLKELSGGREALLFNSGYHANTGIVAAISDSRTLIVADKLVHASIIDGIRLGGANFERFRHNSLPHLEKILAAKASGYETVVVIVESIYSMDGDKADLESLVAIKRRYPNLLLYVDEAHAIGVCGPNALGLADSLGLTGDIDIIVGTCGKALASSGAFVLCDPAMKSFLINRARSLIFSTALPPICAEWTACVMEHLASDHTRARTLDERIALMDELLGRSGGSHIVPIPVGDPRRAVELSQKLLESGFRVLPIRVPTVPPGTDRLRLSLTPEVTPDDLRRFVITLKNLTA